MMSKQYRSLADRSFDMLILFVLWAALLLVIYPIVYIVSASFSLPSAVLTGKVWLFPVEPSLISYATVFRNKQILSGYGNSVIYTVFGTAISVMLTLMAAFPTSRKSFYGRKVIMGIFLFTMLFSAGLVPTYLWIKTVNMLDTRWAMILPNALSIWLVIIAKSFIEQNIPAELYEAAEIDGCHDLHVFVRVVIPLSGPIIAVVALNYAVGIWNSYYDALIYLTDSSKFPLQIILRNILILNKFDVTTVSDYEAISRKQGLADAIKYALIVVSSAPLLMIYPFIQKYFIKGIMVGSIKG